MEERVSVKFLSISGQGGDFVLHQAIPVQKRTQFSAPERKKRDVHVN